METAMWLGASFTSYMAFPLLAASQSSGRALDVLTQWTEALRQVEPYPQEWDGHQGMRALDPILRYKGENSLADRFNESDGAQTWLALPDLHRYALMCGLAERLPPPDQLVMRNEAIQLVQSIGRTRRVMMSVFGELSKPNQEALRILDLNFPQGYGRAFMLEFPFGVAQETSHRIYFPTTESSRPKISYHGFDPVSTEEPLQVGNLTIGGLNVDDLPEDLERDFAGANPVDILMLGGTITDDHERLKRLAGLLKAKLLFVRTPEPTNNFYTHELGTTTVIALGPAAFFYGMLAFDPQEKTLGISINNTSDHETRYRTNLSL